MVHIFKPDPEKFNSQREIIARMTMVGTMKSIINSTRWKTDPRAAFIPPAMMALLILGICVAAGPAWSFETYYGHMSDVQPLSQNSESVATHSRDYTERKKASPVQVDTCLPLLSSSHPQFSDRTQRDAGKAAALGLIFGVRFALTPPKKSKASETKATIGFWHPQPVTSGRSALAVTAYRECQKQEALQALNEFRWKR